MGLWMLKSVTWYPCNSVCFREADEVVWRPVDVLTLGGCWSMWVTWYPCNSVCFREADEIAWRPVGILTLGGCWSLWLDTHVILCVSEKLMKSYGDLSGTLHLVEMERSGKLGLSLSGNSDLGTMSVFVCGIKPDSMAARDGRIRVGDELLEVCTLWASHFSETVSPLSLTGEPT